uniref:Uncharacterized protein n=1 Tax=Anguilla anguilla TaxID=7936 RepID=A0A0E9VT54_ANGAN
MESFREGLRTLSYKCSEDLKQGDGMKTIEALYMFLEAGPMQTSKPTGRSACEVNRKMPFQDFREQLIRLIQQVDSQ